MKVAVLVLLAPCVVLVLVLYQISRVMGPLGKA